MVVGVGARVHLPVAWHSALSRRAPTTMVATMVVRPTATTAVATMAEAAIGAGALSATRRTAIRSSARSRSATRTIRKTNDKEARLAGPLLLRGFPYAALPDGLLTWL